MFLQPQNNYKMSQSKMIFYKTIPSGMGSTGVKDYI